MKLTQPLPLAATATHLRAMLTHQPTGNIAGDLLPQPGRKVVRSDFEFSDADSFATGSAKVPRVPRLTTSLPGSQPRMSVVDLEKSGLRVGEIESPVLDVFVMASAEAGAVTRVERCPALPDADDVVHLDPSAAGFADPFESAAVTVAGADELPCFLPA